MITPLVSNLWLAAIDTNKQTKRIKLHRGGGGVRPKYDQSLNVNLHFVTPRNIILVRHYSVDGKCNANVVYWIIGWADHHCTVINYFW
jgi:hypothetical protein